MTKEIGSVETLIYPAANLTDAQKIRIHLINEFSGCWFYVYCKTSEIFASNEWGGKLTEQKIKDLKAEAVRFNSTLYQVKK